MKKALALILTLVLALSFAACGDKKDDGDATKTENKTIKVGASVTPHAEILEVAKKVLDKEGYTLDIVEYNDYVIPNTATQSGELDANYFQHEPYLNQFNDEKGTDLVSVGAIHYEPFGIYPGKSNDIKNVKDGAVISVPNDGTNEGRALFLLEAQGLIKLKDGIDFSATVKDIAENPKNLDIKELEAAQLARSLSDVNFAVINGNYAIEAGLNVSKDAIAVEDASSDAAKTYANILVVKKGNENNEGIQALLKALKSDEVKDYINKTYDGAVVPMF